ncbi:Zinc finger BED domain-containing protein 2 [Heterocephalus glaber]|uniref:Zinc finger BED domain-containing protein 2 n=1 Tax=Heterocephalus glaber TaxID=10181 RepID=G5C273_HETGA|nr:zinc finger BED domain-containing protein 2 [Heterocephalus glaber]EHB15634.1 Zinc finger BED domain-containing protein 2 [Heterocephalus glaber]
MRREEDEEDGSGLQAKGALAMKEEEEISEPGELAGQFVSAVPTPMPHNRGTRFSEAWEYFHLAPARAGHHPNQYATCRLCSKQVSRGPGINVGTTALWKHLKSMHREELEKSGHSQAGQRQDPRLQGTHLPVGIEGDWARLLEQVGTLTSWASQREKEVLRRERAVEWRERAVQRREQVLEEVERAILEMKWRVRAEKTAHQQEKDLSAGGHPFHFV